MKEDNIKNTDENQHGKMTSNHELKSSSKRTQDRLGTERTELNVHTKGGRSRQSLALGTRGGATGLAPGRGICDRTGRDRDRAPFQSTLWEATHAIFDGGLLSDVFWP